MSSVCRTRLNNNNDGLSPYLIEIISASLDHDLRSVCSRSPRLKAIFHAFSFVSMIRNRSCSKKRWWFFPRESPPSNLNFKGGLFKNRRRLPHTRCYLSTFARVCYKGSMSKNLLIKKSLNSPQNFCSPSSFFAEKNRENLLVCGNTNQATVP